METVKKMFYSNIVTLLLIAFIFLVSLELTDIQVIIVKTPIILILISFLFFQSFNPLLPINFLFRIFESLLFKNNPIYGMFDLTHACNLRCKMCSFWKDRSIKVANYQKGLKTIDSLYAKGVRFLVLTGGEPLLVKHLEDLIRYAKKKGMLCGITTNGTLLTKERFNSLIDAGVNNITVSLDSLKEEIHDDIRGVRGTYKKTLNNFNEIKELPRGICQYLMLMCVISLKNKDEIEKLIKFAGRNKVKIIFQPYNPYRRYDKTFLMSVKDMKETIEKVIKLKNMGYPVFNSRPFLRGFVKYYRGERQKCLAGKLYIHADCNGKLTPCTDCVNSACIKQCLNGRSKTLPGCWMNCTGETESTLTPIGLIDKLYDLILLPIAFIGKREN